MRRQGKGRIVNLSSVLGFIPAPYSALYSSTKHAVEGYSESLDHELRPFGIRVVLVEPAYTRTSFEENLAKPDRLVGIYDSARAGMNVIGGTDRDRVDVLRCLVEHLAEVLVPPRLGERLVGAGGALVVHVAQGDDVGAEPGEGGDVAAPHAPGADARQVDALTRGDEARPSGRR